MTSDEHTTYSSTVDTGYRRGYRNPVSLRDAIARAHATNVWRSMAVAVFDHSTIPVVLLAATSDAVRHDGWLVFCAAVFFGVVVAARQLRALECLVHEASHFNWSRRRRALGDILAAILAGVPTGARIADYRESHLVHHGRFGTTADPDRQRYEQLSLEDLDRSGLVSYAVGLLRRFVPYQRGWLGILGSAPGTALLPFAWCAIVIVLPGWLLGGPVWAGSAALAWLVAHLVALPVVRFIGESSEHVYREADTVFAATVSNLGLAQRLLIHPHGDGYHTIHHMWPGVPHHQFARLHRVLLSEDDEYRNNLKYRTRVLQRPRTGWTKGRATA